MRLHAAWCFGALALALGQLGCSRSPPEGSLDRWVDLGALDAGVARLFDPKAASCRLDPPNLYCNLRLAGGEFGAGFWLEAVEVTSSDLVAVATGVDGGESWPGPPTIVTMRGTLSGKRAVIHSVSDSKESFTSLAVKLGDTRARLVTCSGDVPWGSDACRQLLAVVGVNGLPSCLLSSSRVSVLNDLTFSVPKGCCAASEGDDEFGSITCKDQSVHWARRTSWESARRARDRSGMREFERADGVPEPKPFPCQLPFPGAECEGEANETPRVIISALVPMDGGIMDVVCTGEGATPERLNSLCRELLR